jgi:hypothetical protein
MIAEAESLLFETLKRGHMDNVKTRGMRVEMTGIEQLIAAFMAHDIRRDSEIDSMKLRLDRIERRLDLVE